jgi:hypothetical protein
MSDVLWPLEEDLAEPDDPAELAEVLAALTDPEHLLLFALRREGEAVTALAVALGCPDVALLAYGVAADGVRLLEAGLLPFEDALPEIVDRTAPWPRGAAWLEIQRVDPGDAAPRLVGRFVAGAGVWEPLPPGAELPGDPVDLPGLVAEARERLAVWILDLEVS